jgi:hypothetical protein
MSYGPRYLILGSCLDDDTYVLRLTLAGLNAMAREWGEIITILDNGTFPGLEHEVESFRHLERQRVKSWAKCNVVLCFMDSLRHARENQLWLDRAKEEGVMSYVIQTYASQSWASSARG